MHPDEAPTRTSPCASARSGGFVNRSRTSATALFLAHGFDNVTVAQIAAASEVSEQTVFNYFPTKESMFFDRAEPMTNARGGCRTRTRQHLTGAKPLCKSMPGEIHPSRWEALDEAGQLHLFRRFCEVATGSPTLVAARFADLPRFVDEVSTALAQRVGAEPIDPEVQLARLIIAGLVRVRVQSTFHHVPQATSFAALDDAVRLDIVRAANVAEPSLAAFDDRAGTADH